MWTWQWGENTGGSERGIQHELVGRVSAGRKWLEASLQGGGKAEPFFSLPLLIRNLEVSWLKRRWTYPLSLPTAHMLVYREAHSLCVGNWPAVYGRPSPALNLLIYVNRLGDLASGSQTSLQELQTSCNCLVCLWVLHLSSPPSNEKEYGVFYLSEVLSEEWEK